MKEAVAYCRVALQSLLADCRAGKIGTVITQDPERLSRDPLSLIAVLDGTFCFLEMHLIDLA